MVEQWPFKPLVGGRVPPRSLWRHHGGDPRLRAGRFLFGSVRYATKHSDNRPDRSGGGAGLAGGGPDRPRPGPLPEVFAEAVGQANLRSGPGIDYPVVGEIADALRVLARHSLVPWLRLTSRPRAARPVYAELVTVTGNLAGVPPVDGFDPVGRPPRRARPPAARHRRPPRPRWRPPPRRPPPGPWLPRSATRTCASAWVEYPAITEVPAGASFRVVERHSLVPWVRVVLPDSRSRPAGFTARSWRSRAISARCR